MTRCLITLLVLPVLLTGVSLAGDDQATTWDEALALSKQHDRPILIDFFTEW